MRALKARGRNVHTCHDEGWKGLDDDELLPKVEERFPGAVLITGDRSMPDEWPWLLAKHHITLAIIDKAARPTDLWEPSTWPVEVVLRWVHLMEAQAKNSIFIYGLTKRRWTSRKRPLRGVRFPHAPRARRAGHPQGRQNPGPGTQEVLF